MECRFTYDYYQKMLKTATGSGYKITSFAGYDKQHPRTVILRHDIDYTLDGVLRFGEIERELGITASYLVRMHADEYNPFACISFNVLQELSAMGHEIGLHYECMSVGRALGLPPDEVLKREKKTLEDMLGFEIHTCSEHRELSSVVHGTPLFDETNDVREFGFTHYAMAPEYCQDMKYLSDSNANWKSGDLLENLGAFDRFQILVHPYWWFESDLLLKGRYHHPRSVHL